MAEILNLRIARKRAARRKADEQAATNRNLHGISRHEREHALAERAQTLRKLDSHRIDEREATDEFTSREAIDHNRRPQNQRQP